MVLPAAITLEWVGEIRQSAGGASARLEVVVPISIGADLACCCSSISVPSRDMLLAASVIPMALSRRHLRAVF